MKVSLLWLDLHLYWRGWIINVTEGTFEFNPVLDRHLSTFVTRTIMEDQSVQGLSILGLVPFVSMLFTLYSRVPQRPTAYGELWSMRSPIFSRDMTVEMARVTNPCDTGVKKLNDPRDPLNVLVASHRTSATSPSFVESPSCMYQGSVHREQPRSQQHVPGDRPCLWSRADARQMGLKPYDQQIVRETAAGQAGQEVHQPAI